MCVCVLDKWYSSTSFSELEVDKAVTCSIGVCVCVCVCVSWTNGIPALSILSWKLIKQLHVVLVCVCVCVCPGRMVFQHLVF